jgi:hypothetical protein
MAHGLEVVKPVVVFSMWIDMFVSFRLDKALTYVNMSPKEKDCVLDFHLVRYLLYHANKRGQASLFLLLSLFHGATRG